MILKPLMVFECTTWIKVCRSSSEYPFEWRIRICFVMVDFPLSPSPSKRIFIVSLNRIASILISWSIDLLITGPITPGATFNVQLGVHPILSLLRNLRENSRLTHVIRRNTKFFEKMKPFNSFASYNLVIQSIQLCKSKSRREIVFNDKLHLHHLSKRLKNCFALIIVKNIFYLNIA